MLKKIFTIFASTLLLFSLSLGFTGDIFPQNKPGIFLQISNIGYSWGKLEIKTAPIQDFLGIYNLAFRNYMSSNSVNQYSIAYYDINKLLFYNEKELGNLKLGLWIIDSYNHSNFFINNISIKSQINLSGVGIHVYYTDSATKFDVYSIYAKGLIQTGYYFDCDKEAFLSLESGKVFTIETNLATSDSYYDEIVGKIKSESLYIMAKIGIKWYMIKILILILS